VVQLVAQVLPAGPLGDEEGVLVVALGVRPLLGLLARAPLPELLGDDLLAAGLEHVRAPLQEQHPEDVLLELRGIHLAPQDVRRVSALNGRASIRVVAGDHQLSRQDGLLLSELVSRPASATANATH